MASYKKKASGKYKVRWRTLSGSERSRTVPTKAVAVQLVAAIEGAQALGREWEPERPREVPRLRALMAAYLESRAGMLSAQTIVSQGNAIEMFVRWAEKRHGRTVKADVLSRRLLREYFEHLSSSDSRHKRPRALSTCQRNLTCIFTAWSWCYERDDELNGGAWKDQIPRPRKPNLPRAGTHMTVRAPTWKEMDRLIGELEGWGRKLAILQRCAGLRRGAALALTWADVDLEHGWLALRAEITKGGYGGRSVPLAPVLTQELKRWGPDEGLILADAPTGRALERRLRCFGQAWKRAGVDPRVWEKRPTHSLRKGFASGLRELGAQPDAVEVLLGHSLGNSRGAYIDHVALKLREAVALVPPLKL